MPFDRPFSAVQSDVSSALVSTARTVGQIADEDIAFQRYSNPEIVPLIERQSRRLLNLTQRLVSSAATNADLPVPRLSNVESVDDQWRGLVDIYDNLLEKADACLDEYTGVIQRLDTPGQGYNESGKRRDGKGNMSSATKSPGSNKQKSYLTRDFRTQQNLAKPQLKFSVPPDNTATAPFKPLLTSKPHAIRPLKDSLTLPSPQDSDSHSGNATAKPAEPPHHNQVDSHPYTEEITAWAPLPQLYEAADPIPSQPFEATQATFVDSPDALQQMIDELKLASEIAIDLEHHDEHSYIGLVSLMQISTRKQDWIVDTLVPWRRDLQILNEVFADPRILKVFHGSNMDMIWLQRDLGLYVVGLFDTYHASWALGYPKHSLAYLLKRFVDFDAAKQYQMADWRIRPLPAEMFDYARSDTHFLLYIHDMIRNELVERLSDTIDGLNLVDYVVVRSKEESLQTYQAPIYDAAQGKGPMGWWNLLYRSPARLDREQFAVFRAVHQWRDNVAREEDESVHCILSKRSLFNIARDMPNDERALRGCTSPASSSFHARKTQLLDIIRNAKALSANGPDMRNFFSFDEDFAEENDHDGKRLDVSTSASVISKGPAPTVASLVGQIRSGIAVNDTVDRLRSADSSFWGPTIEEKKTLQPRPNGFDLFIPIPEIRSRPDQENRNDRAALSRDSASSTTHQSNDHTISTLTPVTATSTASAPASALASASAPAPAPAPSSGPIPKRKTPVLDARDADDVFTVREVSRQAKKSRIAAASDTTGLDSETRPDDPKQTRQSSDPNGQDRDEKQILQNQQARQQRKLDKTHRREEAAARERRMKEEAMAAVPFDYTAAPSVMHANSGNDERIAKQKAKQGQGQGQGQAKNVPNTQSAGIQPYAKSSNVSSSLPRTQQHGAAGRSMTFR